MTKVFGNVSESNLKGVHPHLVRVLRKALTMLPEDLDFRVTEGLRTVARQRELLRKGLTRTMNSRHLTGHAVDVFVLVKGVGTWDFKHYKRLAAVIKQAAKLEKVPIVWGGDWITFKDGPHFELNRKVYP